MLVKLLCLIVFSQIEWAGAVSSQDGKQMRVEPAAAVASPSSSAGPQCETTGTGKLTVSCTYNASPAIGSVEGATPRVLLNRAVLVFGLWQESHMHIELEFTNESGTKILEPRTVYLAIDDSKGLNHMRRPLPELDFTKLPPGKTLKFEETLLAPAFSPGPYTISLWIPSNDPALKFDPKHNFLLSSVDVPESDTGLNRIAKFVSTPGRRGKSTGLPD
jgi:hypothetical protein